MAHPVVATSTSATTGSGSANSLTISVPSGTADGDLLIATLTRPGTNVPTPPSGWTQVNTAAYSTAVSLYVWYRIASSEPASYSWSWSGFTAASGSMLRITGAHATAPCYVTSTRAATTSTSHQADQVDATETETLLLGFYGNGANGSAYTAPSGMTEVIDVAASIFNGGGLGVSRLNLSSTGVTGNKTATCAVSGVYGAILVGVKPPAAAADATVAPAVIAAQVTVPQAVTSDAVIFAATIAATVTIPQATVLTPDATVEPAAIATTVTMDAASAQAGITVEPAAIAATVTLPAATPTAGAVVSPAVITATTAVPIAAVAIENQYPTVTVEFSPTTAPLSTPVWVDITDYVQSARWRIGREHALEGEFRPAVADVTLVNDTRRFDPEHAAGPYYNQLTPGRRLRIRVTYEGVTYAAFGGFVEGWPQTYSFPEVADCTVSATDGLTLLGWVETAASPLEAQIEALAPEHWWRLDEKAGATEVFDSGTGRQNGTPVGGAQDNLGFSPGVDRISEAPCLQLRNAGGGYVNVTGAALWTTFAALAKGDPVTGQGLDYLWSSTNGDDWQFVGMYGNTGRITASDGTTQRTTAGAYNDGDVHLIVVTSAAGTCNIYVDGVLDNGTASPADPAPSGYRAYIGNHIDPNETKWNGKVGHVALWTSALTAGQISTLQETIVGWDDDTTGGRVNHLLDLAGWPSADRDVADDGVPLGAVNGQDWTDDVLANLKVVEQSEAGQFYQEPDYTMRFRTRTEPLVDPRSTTPRYVFSDEDTTGVYRYESLEFGDQSTYLYNRVKVSYTGGEVTVADAASVAAYGPRDHTISTALSTANAARNLAEAVLYQFSYPRLIVKSLELNPAADERLWLPCLDLQIGDRVTVRRHPQSVGTAISVDVIVEGVSAQIDQGRDVASFRFALSTPMSPGGPSGGGGGGGDDFWIWGTGEWGTSTKWA